MKSSSYSVSYYSLLVSLTTVERSWYSSVFKMKLLFCVLFAYSLGTSSVLGSDPDEFRSLEEIIRSHGLDVELHNITTDDGYYLALYRIVNPKTNLFEEHGDNTFYSYTVDRKPVIVQHGLFGSAADFLISSPFLTSNNSKTGDNLGFGLHLTDRYDVWLANSRGNRYSRGHRKYAPDDRRYWQFSFDQMARFDTPAIVNYVRNVTQRKTVGYVGYSQGTAMMFALLTLQPEYADIVKPFIALAPVTTVSDIESPIKYLSSLGPFLRLIGEEFLPSDRLVNRLSELFCANYVEEKYICQNMVFLFSGYDPKHLNITRIPVYFQFLPSSVSSWDIAHWAQLIQSKRFARFDYGSAAENRAAYGQPTVPDFPLEKIPSNAVISLFRGRNDFLSSIPDTERLIRILKKSGVNLTDHIVADPSWTHIDFAIGVDAGRLVYDLVVKELDKWA